MQLSTEWEIIIHTLKYVLGFRNDNLLTIGGHVLAVPSIERHLVSVGWARSTVTFPIDDHYNVLAPTLKIYPNFF